MTPFQTSRIISIALLPISLWRPATTPATVANRLHERQYGVRQVKETTQRREGQPCRSTPDQTAHRGLQPNFRLRPNFRLCANSDHGQRSANCSEQRLGSGYGANAASITRRLLVPLPSSGGDRTRPVTNYELALAAPVAAVRVQPSSIQAGPAIILASVRFRPASSPPLTTGPACSARPSDRCQASFLGGS